MFLSFYTFYHLANMQIDKRMYLLIMIILPILMSVLSTFYSLLGLAGIIFPLYSFSFPFVYMSHPIDNRGITSNIFFFHTPIVLISQLTLQALFLTYLSSLC